MSISRDIELWCYNVPSMPFAQAEICSRQLSLKEQSIKGILQFLVNSHGTAREPRSSNLISWQAYYKLNNTNVLRKLPVTHTAAENEKHCTTSSFFVSKLI